MIFFMIVIITIYIKLDDIMIQNENEFKNRLLLLLDD